MFNKTTTFASISTFFDENKIKNHYFSENAGLQTE